MAEQSIINAKLAELAERYDDMVDYMTKYIKSGSKIDTEVRNLLSVAYKNKIGARRSSWRILTSEEMRTTDAQKLKRIKKYKSKIESELDDMYKAILELIDEYLIPNINQEEDNKAVDEKVFYYKMKGDYCRYKAEFSAGADKEEAAQKSLEAYKNADEAAASLKPTNPTRLGLSLNFSVFYYEIQNDPKLACEVAKKAFDSAIANLDSVPEENYKDSTLIMQLLRDNLTLWTSDTTDGSKEDAEEIDCYP